MRHRLMREAKVASALDSAPQSLDGLVVTVYDDVDPVMHEWAKLSLLAHLIKLEGEGRTLKSSLKASSTGRWLLDATRFRVADPYRKSVHSPLEDQGERTAMNGLMMDVPLTITSIVRHAERVHGHKEIVSITRDNPATATPIATVLRGRDSWPTPCKLWDLQSGDRVATLAWNDYRHMETYYGSACSGFVCHTINPRLFPEQIVYIINHAEDRYVFLDPDFWPLIEGIAGECTGVEGWVVMTTREHMPETDRAMCCATRRSWRGRALTLSGPSSMSRRPVRSATPPAPRATLKACSTAIAPLCSTLTPP